MIFKIWGTKIAVHYTYFGIHIKMLNTLYQEYESISRLASINMVLTLKFKHAENFRDIIYPVGMNDITVDPKYRI